MLLSTRRRATHRAARRAAFTLLEVLVVVSILVILASLASVATFSQLDKARQNEAVLKAKYLADACEKYYMDANSNQQFPSSIQQLAQGFPGQSSFLKDPLNDIYDPWHQPYQIRPYTLNDGMSQGVVVYTQTRSGVEISQFGIGNNANPNQQRTTN